MKDYQVQQASDFMFPVLTIMIDWYNGITVDVCKHAWRCAGGVSYVAL